MRRLALMLGLVAALAHTGAAQQQADVSPDEARILAARLLTSGQPKAALDLTSVLIARNPEDGPSLIVHAQALRSLAQYGPAQKAARRAWGASTHPLDRYAAALAMAQSLSADGKKTRAQFWLRRAAHVAPNERLKARAARDYGYLRRTNPWSVNLSFGITPSDNVNNAPRDNTWVLLGVPLTDPAAVPLSGFEIRTDVNLRYNFNENANLRHFVSMLWTESQIVFTDDNVPAGVEESTFAYRKLEATLGRDFIAGPGKPRQTVSLTLAQIWTGGSTLGNEIRLDWREVHLRPGGKRFAWDASLGYTKRHDNDIRSGVEATLGGQWSRPLENGGRLGWQTEVARNDTDSRALTHTRLNFGVQYTHPERIMGAIAQVGLQGEVRQYDDPLYGPQARRDTRATLTTSLLFVDFDTYGFAPKVTFEASRTESNVTRFETQNLGLQIGFQSLF